MGGSGVAEDLTFSQYFITNFLKDRVIFNKTIAKLPRFVVDPIVRNLLYIEYLIQKHLFKDDHNLHKTINSKVSSKIRIPKKYLDPKKTTQKDRSLRTIVAKKMKELNRSDQEKLISSLTGGP